VMGSAARDTAPKGNRAGCEAMVSIGGINQAGGHAHGTLSG